MNAIAQHLADSIASAHGKIRDHVAADKMAHVTALAETIESEYGPILQPLVAHILDNPDVPQEIRNLIGPLTEPTNLGQSVILGIALGSILGPVLGTGLAPFVQDLANAVWPKCPVMPLSPATVADAVLRHNPAVPHPYGEAALSGINEDRLNALVYNAGNALAPGELLDLFRRGQISEERLVTGVHQDRLRDEWIPELKMLRYSPPGVGTVVEGALKGHLTHDDAQAKAAHAGLAPNEFDWVRASAGRPPGIEQMLHLRNRDQATTADVVAAVRQSDINDDFLKFVLHLGEYHPPVRSIMAMLRAGAIDDTRATALFKNQGVLDADIPGYIREAHHTRTAAVKHLSQSQVITMFLDGIFTHAQAHDRLVSLGYQPTDTDLLLQLAEDHKRARYAGAVITKVHALYVGHKIDHFAARNALAADGLDPTAINNLIGLWDIERDANVHGPSVPMVLHAYRQHVITPAETKRRLTDLGVQPADLAVVVANGYPPTTTPATLGPLIAAVVNA